MESHTLFSPLNVGTHALKNRIFSTGHMTVMLENGLPTDAMVAYHAARAKGGVGLIIMEAARAHPSGDSGRPAIRAYSDECIPGYRRIAGVCHEHGCKLIAQLSHPGREMTLGADGTLAVGYAPSPVPNERFHVMPRELSGSLIEEIVQGFASSATRLRTAGVDGVEIVASHGYLVSQFFNPRTNLRTDKYGGSFDNRLRFAAEILAAVREEIGLEMMLGMRLSGDEKDHDGLEPDETLAISETLVALGLLDYLNVTAGTSAGLAGSTHIVPPMAFETAYTAPLAARIKSRLDIPIFVAGRINQPQIAEQVLTAGQADMCGMTRALIADSDMPAKARQGRLEDIRACVACNQACIGHMLNGFPISCIQHPETGREIEFGTLHKTSEPRSIMVVGGGPAGMKAACVAANRGHHVSLFEAKSNLGGQVNLAQLLPGRAEFGGVTTNLAREMMLAGVDLSLNTKVTAETIDLLKPDAVVVATGALPFNPEIEGQGEGHVVNAWQVLEGQVNVGSRVVIADWRCDWIGLGLAEQLSREGCHVRLAVNGTMAGQSIPQYARDKWLGELHRLGVEIVPYARLFGVDESSAYFQHTLSGEPLEFNDVDTLVTAQGHMSSNSLAPVLEAWGGEWHLIGDCLAPRTVEEAVLEGLRVSWAL